jgi:hypothetical protein
VAKDVVRPEKIRSKREIVYDRKTYAELATLWQKYYAEFPSEDAYANWVYAARYADLPDYSQLLQSGIKKFPANPVLLYLAGVERHGLHNWQEGRDYLERAVALDPTFNDPWFALVIHFMDLEDETQTDAALRHLLANGAISEVVLDYSYNMLAGLAPEAILVTNGDNDTYPGWILTRLLGHRPDVTLVNRSLLNTSWYPGYLMKRGLPAFITADELVDFRQETLADLKAGKSTVPPMGPFSDFLLARIIESAREVGRPVYFSATLASSPQVDEYQKNGRLLGLAFLVTPGQSSYPADEARSLDLWLADYRTVGLDAWGVRYAHPASSERNLVRNYAACLHRLLQAIVAEAPELATDAFFWHQDHVAPLLAEEWRQQLDAGWCKLLASPAVQAWCQQRDLGE